MNRFDGLKVLNQCDLADVNDIPDPKRVGHVV
jgi:hypothetical protein